MNSPDPIDPETKLLAFFAAHAISFEKHEHAAVFTCEQATALNLKLPGTDTKNLFLAERGGKRRFLVVVPHHKKVQLSALAEQLQVRKFDFGSEAELLTLLGVTPGAVTLLGLMYDAQHRIQLVIDRELWGAPLLQCHPLRNTATLVLAHEAIERFLAATGHQVQVIEVPQRAG